MSISQRIREIRKQKNLNQEDFSAAMGVKQASISQYESGKHIPSTDFMKRLAKVYNVNLNWLMNGPGIVPVYDNERAREDSSLIRLPIAGLIAAGAPTELVPDEEPKYIEVSPDLLSLPPPYFVFQVDGESMLPLIYPDDYVIISRNWRGIKLNKRICAFRDCDGITLKQYVLDHKHKTAWLWPLNSTYNPLQYNQDTPELTLIGVLVLSIRKYT